MRTSSGSIERSIDRAGVGRGFATGLLLLGALLALAQPALAQTGTIRGTVVEGSTRRPLAGVQVFLQGGGGGTISNQQGAFLIVNVPSGQRTVRAQLIGYAAVSQQVAVEAGQTATVNFELSPSAVALDEVVVTGAGIATEKRRLGNTVATIDATQLENQPVANFSEVLAGREPGVTVMPSGGLTGEGAGPTRSPSRTSRSST
jgi:TonB-dependent starch-binding outer membrane protein SusC